MAVVRVLIGGCLLFLLLSGLQAIPVSADQTRRLDQTRQDLESVKGQIESTSSALAGKQRSAEALVRQLRDVRQRVEQAARQVARAENELEQVRKEIRSEEAAYARAQKEISVLETQIRARLVALYKGGDGQGLQMLFSSSSPAELIENFTFLRLLVDHDRELLSAYRSMVAVNEKRLAHLARLKTGREAAVQRQREVERALKKARSDKSQILEKLRQDEAALALVLEELEEQAARLEALVNRLESEKPGAYTGTTGPFAAQKGKLEWPVGGRLLTRFGQGVHAELGTRYDSHGIEIEVDGRVPVAAVWDGKVVFASAFRGYGNLLIIDHGEGYYSLYAQASELLKQVGAPVSRGEKIAYSGYEGGETVYFEIRQGGTAQDPLAWLRRSP